MLTPLAGVGDRHSRPDLRRGDRQVVRLCPLLRAGPAPGPARGSGHLVGRCADPARALQGPCLLPRAERLSRRPRVPRHVHRRRRRDRALAPARAVDDRRCCDGDRRDDRCDARPAARALLLVVLFLQADSVQLTPLVIVAIVVSYIVSARLTPVPPGAARAPPRQRAAPRPPLTRPCESMSR